MSDAFSGHAAGLTSPAEQAFEIIPDDGVDLAVPTRALCVSGSGTVRVTTLGGSTATLYLAAGVPFPVRASRIWTSGTSATGIVGLS